MLLTFLVICCRNCHGGQNERPQWQLRLCQGRIRCQGNVLPEISLSVALPRYHIPQDCWRQKTSPSHKDDAWIRLSGETNQLHSHLPICSRVLIQFVGKIKLRVSMVLQLIFSQILSPLTHRDEIEIVCTYYLEIHPSCWLVSCLFLPNQKTCLFSNTPNRYFKLIVECFEPHNAWFLWAASFKALIFFLVPWFRWRLKIMQYYWLGVVLWTWSELAIPQTPVVIVLTSSDSFFKNSQTTSINRLHPIPSQPKVFDVQPSGKPLCKIRML